MFNIPSVTFTEFIAALIPLFGALAVHRAATRAVHATMNDVLVGTRHVLQLRLNRIVSLMPKTPLPPSVVRMEYFALLSAVVAVLCMVDNFVDIFPNFSKEIVIDALGLDKPTGIFIFMSVVIYVLISLYGARFADIASRAVASYGLEPDGRVASSLHQVVDEELETTTLEQREASHALRVDRAVLRDIIDRLPKDGAARRSILDRYSPDDGFAD